MDLSVIVCAYTLERWDVLTEALQAVYKQEPSPAEVILVVDHNVVMLSRAKEELPEVIVLANQGQPGLSGARNTGVRAARGDILVFLDDDALPEPGWLRHLLQGYAHEDVLGVGGAIMPAWQDGRPTWFPEEFDWVVGSTYRGMPEQRAPVRNLIGANMSFRRTVFDQVGGFNEDLGRIGSLPAGCEETELSIRTRQRLPNGRLLYQPEARVRHLVPASRATWRYFASRCFAEGQSKAQVASIVGAVDGLDTERTYTLRTLPKGVLQGLGDGLSGDLAGFLRAAAIILGFGLTATGFLWGKVQLGLRGAIFSRNPVTAE